MRKLCALWAGCVASRGYRCVAAITHASRALLRSKSDITATLPPSPRPWATSLAVAVFVINADERASEGQYLAEGDENTVMNLRQRWKDKARGKHYAPEGAQCKRCEELNVFSHCIIAPTVQF